MNTYKVDFTNNTITITAAFAKAMNNPASEEYKIVAQILKDFPNMEITHRTHKTPTTYTSKSTGKKTRCNQLKNLKYENMEGFIKGLPNNEKYLTAYNFLKNCGSLPQTSRYTVVRKWFVAQFPEFRENPLFYLYNEVDIINIAPYIEEEQKRVLELAEKKANAQKTA